LTLFWKIDPILFDVKPQPSSKWETANSLIKQGKKSKIFQPEYPKLSLYPIMIRKIDFTRSERLFQTMPYLALPAYWSDKLRKQSLSLAEKCHYYFNNTSADFSIRNWQRKIIQYCKHQNRIPLPIFRLVEEWESFFNLNNKIQFQSARGEQFFFPTNLTNDLAYMAGEIIGDGHLNYHNIELVDFSLENIQMLQTLGEKLLGIKGAISGEKKRWLLHLNNKWFVRLINFLTDQPITGKKYDFLKEPLIFQFNEEHRKHFWSGVLDADGCYLKQTSLCSKSKSFVDSFGDFLTDYNIQFKIRSISTDLGDGFVLRTKAEDKKKIAQIIQPRHIIKLKDFQKYIYSKTYKPRKNRTDSLTIQLKTNQNLKFNKFNDSTIKIINGNKFFDFSLLPELGVLNCQQLIKEIRTNKGWTLQKLANFLDISKERLFSYEHNTAIPIEYLRKLHTLYYQNSNQFILFLKKNNLMFYNSRKTEARLDLQPSKYLLDLISHLGLRRNYLLINYSKEDIEQFYLTLAKYFSIHPPINNRIGNSVLYKYVKTFFKY